MMSFHKHLNPTAVKERLGELTRPTGAEDVLTIDYPEVKQLRWRIEPAVALKLAAVVAILAVGFLSWQRYFKPPEPTRPFPISVAAATSAPESASPASLVVAVVGEVEHPGLHTLAPDARIADALTAAQPYPHGQTLGLNLAQKLTDGQQIHVPHVDAGQVIPVDSTAGGASGAAGTAGATANTTSTDGKISLNSATAEQLESLDGVGTKTAQAIIAYREANGGFSDIAQLQEVKGIGPAKFAAISPQVSL